MQVYSLDIGHIGKPQDDEIERYLDDVLSSHRRCLRSSRRTSRWATSSPIPVLARVCARYPHVIGINCTNPDINYLTATLRVGRRASRDLHGAHDAGARRARRRRAGLPHDRGQPGAPPVCRGHRPLPGRRPRRHDRRVRPAAADLRPGCSATVAASATPKQTLALFGLAGWHPPAAPATARPTALRTAACCA